MGFFPYHILSCIEFKNLINGGNEKRESLLIKIMKKLLGLFSILLIVLIVSTSCTKVDSTSKGEASQTVKQRQWKIAFIAGGLFGDQGMNDAMLKGVKDFSDKSGIKVTSVEVSESGDTMINANNFAEQNYDLVLMGSNYSDVIGETAEAYPKTTFIINKGSVHGDNLVSVKFNEPDGAFLAGAYAALLTKELGGKPTIGWVGGMRIPDLEISKFAFKAGAKVFGVDTNTVYIGDFKDSAKSKEITLQMYNDGIKVVQSFCGGAASGVYQAAESQPEGNYALGSATGQFHMSDKIVASQVVNYDIYYQQILASFVENNGEIDSQLLEGTLANGGVGIKYSPKHQDVATKEMREKIESLKQKVINKEIKVPTSEESFNKFSYKVE